MNNNNVKKQENRGGLLGVIIGILLGLFLAKILLAIICGRKN